MEKIRLQIISPKRIIYDGECTMLEYNTTEGYVGILPGHIAMTQIVAPGQLSIYEEGKEKPFVASLHSGLVKIMPDVVMILAEIIELPDEIDVERANKAKERAEKRIEEKAADLDWKRAELALKRAITRLNVAEIK